MGILLSLKGPQMRVAVKDADDVEEFQLIDGFWISEEGESVTFEFPTAIFEAIGIVPDESTIKSDSSLLWGQDSESPLPTDALN